MQAYRRGRAGVTTTEAEEIKRLKRENAELKQANEILKAASAFFAAELDLCWDCFDFRGRWSARQGTLSGLGHGR